MMVNMESIPDQLSGMAKRLRELTSRITVRFVFFPECNIML